MGAGVDRVRGAQHRRVGRPTAETARDEQETRRGRFHRAWSISPRHLDDEPRAGGTVFDADRAVVTFDDFAA